MAKATSIPRRRRLPVSRGNYMVDVVRGVLRIRKWPKKRGPPKSEHQLFWIDFFRQATLLTKYADANSQRTAIELTKGTGKYPRDLLMQAMRGRLYTWIDQYGWKWYPMAALQDISESLDVVAQTVGNILVRGATLWQPVPGGVLGNVLTNKGPGVLPQWLAPAGGGGITQEQLAGSPIIPDGTKSQYDFDISAYKSVTVTYDAVGFAASTRPAMRLSVDSGVTFKAGATDYRGIEVSHGSSRLRDLSWILTTVALGTANHRGVYNFSNLLAGRLSWDGIAANTTSVAAVRDGLFAFDSPVTDIRIYAESGANFNAGTIWVVGEK